MDAMFQCEGVVKSLRVIGAIDGNCLVRMQITCKDYSSADGLGNAPIREAIQYMEDSGQPIVGNTLKYDGAATQMALRQAYNKFPHRFNTELFSVKFKVDEDSGSLNATFEVGMSVPYTEFNHLVDTCMNAEEARDVQMLIFDRPGHDLPSVNAVTAAADEIFPKEDADEPAPPTVEFINA